MKREAKRWKRIWFHFSISIAIAWHRAIHRARCEANVRFSTIDDECASVIRNDIPTQLALPSHRTLKRNMILTVVGHQLILRLLIYLFINSMPLSLFVPKSPAFAFGSALRHSWTSKLDESGAQLRGVCEYFSGCPVLNSIQTIQHVHSFEMFVYRRKRFYASIIYANYPVLLFAFFGTITHTWLAVCTHFHSRADDLRFLFSTLHCHSNPMNVVFAFPPKGTDRNGNAFHSNFHIGFRLNCVLFTPFKSRTHFQRSLYRSNKRRNLNNGKKRQTQKNYVKTKQSHFTDKFQFA